MISISDHVFTLKWEGGIRIKVGGGGKIEKNKEEGKEKEDKEKEEGEDESEKVEEGEQEKKEKEKEECKVDGETWSLLRKERMTQGGMRQEEHAKWVNWDDPQRSEEMKDAAELIQVTVIGVNGLQVLGGGANGWKVGRQLNGQCSVMVWSCKSVMHRGEITD